MPHPLAPLVQSVAALAMPLTLAVLPAEEGAMRTVALTHVPAPDILNAVIAADGRLVSATSDGGFVVTGPRARLLRALLRLGVVAVPAAPVLCGSATA